MCHILNNAWVFWKNSAILKPPQKDPKKTPKGHQNEHPIQAIGVYPGYFDRILLLSSSIE
jgi:hypothetical protein